MATDPTHTHIVDVVALEQMHMQQRIARILEQIDESVLRPHDAHQRLVRARRQIRKIGVLAGLAGGNRVAGDDATDADHVLDGVAELLLEIAVVRLQLAVLDADGELIGGMKNGFSKSVHSKDRSRSRIPTLSCVSRVQMSATDHDSIADEKRGSTEAVPRQVNEISLVFIAAGELAIF